MSKLVIHTIDVGLKTTINVKLASVALCHLQWLLLGLQKIAVTALYIYAAYNMVFIVIMRSLYGYKGFCISATPELLLRHFTFSVCCTRDLCSLQLEVRLPIYRFAKN